MIGVGIIGAGRVSGGHAHAVQNVSRTGLKAVAEVDKTRLEAFANKYKCDAYQDYKELLARDDIQLVMVGLPHGVHCKFALDAAEAQKHIFMEKPMAISVEECDQMIEAAYNNRVKLFVAHTHHFVPANIEAKRILQGGKLGKVVLATDTWYKPFGPEARPPWFLDRAQGGGMWLMNGAHLLDRLAWMLESRIVVIKALVGNQIYGFNSDDSAIALVQFENGVYATTMHTGYREGVEKFEAEYSCTHGMLKLDGNVWISENGAYKKIEVKGFHPFVRELDEFAQAIEEDTEPPITPEYARHIVAALVAAEKSYKTGREVILK